MLLEENNHRQDGVMQRGNKVTTPKLILFMFISILYHNNLQIIHLFSLWNMYYLSICSYI